MIKLNSLIVISTLVISHVAIAQKDKSTKETKPEQKEILLKSETYSSLVFRGIGPAVTSGRVGDIAVNPKNKSQWYVVAAAGGVFKTDNNGTSFYPIFDNQSSYSIGCITIDQNNTNVIWVGTGENNNQRAVGYGDGVYKSEDGGKSWKNMGLANSQHIGRISIDPKNSDIVYVAAYGALWNSSSERGIYKTTDGGKTWKQSLFVSDNTGFNDVLIDNKHPNIIYAAAHQRRRHEYTYISGGPESAIYKSVDEGATWNKLTNGLPSGDVGRIGLAISPANTDVVYAIIEAAEGKGFYRSSNRGASWDKQSEWSTAGNYYQEIVADPINENKVYSLDTWAQVTTDGGKTFKGVGEKNKHVDNHAIYIDQKNTNHLIMGCDGGIYESYDQAKTWRYCANLPITQFYRVCTDNNKPFYNVYAGTQDNNTLGGPARTMSASGITNADWYVTVGGDGFQSRVDPTDPNIIYSQSQYGGLIRFDKKTGEQVDIKPMEKAGEDAYRFNWDAPIIISKFDNKRIYFAANKLFRSDNRGNGWKVISPDLTANIDRNKLPVMGKVWSIDAVAKNQSTSIYGNITALTESPLNEKLIVVGTDDGLIQITDNGGASWNKISALSGVPNQVLVQNVLASRHNENEMYACFNNHRNGDFKPYLMKSSDKGKTWTNISHNLPEKGSVYCVAEDSKNKNLIFCGTEFGFYFSIDAGSNWIEITSGLPQSICIHDIAIQEQANDIIIATFGRGLFVLDDYTILQNIKKADLEKRANIFPISDALVFNESTPYGHTGKSFQGESFYTAPNPAIGANIRFYLKEDFKTLKEKRKELEKEKNKNNQIIYYPSKDSIRIEEQEEAVYTLLVITDEQGNEIRKLKQDAKSGLHQAVWDGRLEVTSPVTFYVPSGDNPYESADKGPVALPGKYAAQLIKIENGISENLSDKISFNLTTLNNGSIPEIDKAKLISFNKELSELRRVILGTSDYMNTINERVKFLKAGLQKGPTSSLTLLADIKTMEQQMHTLTIKMHGDGSIAKHEFETLQGIINTVETLAGGTWSQSHGMTETYEEKLKLIKPEFKTVYDAVIVINTQLQNLETKAEALKLPSTPNRLPKWNGE